MNLEITDEGIEMYLKQVQGEIEFVLICKDLEIDNIEC